MNGRFTNTTPKELVVGLMKHVSDGREGRKRAKYGTLGPMKQRAVPTASKSCDLIARAMGKEESENPRIQCELSNWKSSCYQVGETGDRSVRAEKVLQQAEKNKDSATQKKSRKSRKRR